MIILKTKMTETQPPWKSSGPNVSHFRE